MAGVLNGRLQCWSLLRLLEWELMTSVGTPQTAYLYNFKLPLCLLKCGFPHVSGSCCGLLTDPRSVRAGVETNRTCSPEFLGQFQQHPASSGTGHLEAEGRGGPHGKQMPLGAIVWMLTCSVNLGKFFNFLSLNFLICEKRVMIQPYERRLWESTGII